MKLFILMLVILNPFSQILYLKELMDNMTFKEFFAIHTRATMLSFGVFAIFVLGGDPILNDVFQVQLGSLQIFGGLVGLFIAHRYVTLGPGSNLLFRGDISDLAPNISLPYMVGPGTLWLAILIGRQHPWPVALSMVTGVLAINLFVVVGAKFSYQRLQSHKETMFGKYMAILMRTMALFIGAISVQMILDGIEQTLLSRGGV